MQFLCVRFSSRNGPVDLIAPTWIVLSDQKQQVPLRLPVCLQVEQSGPRLLLVAECHRAQDNDTQSWRPAWTQGNGSPCIFQPFVRVAGKIIGQCKEFKPTEALRIERR